MKHKILKFSTVILLFAFMGASCHKDEIKLDDENIEIELTGSGISIYKTKGDYNHFIAVTIDDKGKLGRIPAIEKDYPKMRFDSKGRMIYSNCYFLKNGYVLGHLNSYSVITDITIKEYREYNIEKGVTCWPDELILSRILDRNPFTEFYFLAGFNKAPRYFTLGEINKMIEEGTLETVFKKLK